MAKYKVGQKYGRITILDIYPYKKGDGGTRKGLVVCDCTPDKSYEMNIYNLGTGHTQSCGCYAVEKATSDSTTHGYSKSQVYKIYMGMIARCYKENSTSYPRYGAKGVSVCNRWKESFENFLEDMGEPPEGMSLDREDNKGNYTPENCRWSTNKQQSNNRSNNILINYKGKTQTLSQWAEELGFNYHSLIYRLERGWSHEKTLSTPIIDCNKYHTFKGETKSHQEWAKLYNLKESTLRHRLKKGWNLEKALTTPVR